MNRVSLFILLFILSLTFFTSFRVNTGIESSLRSDENVGEINSAERYLRVYNRSLYQKNTTPTWKKEDNISLDIIEEKNGITVEVTKFPNSTPTNSDYEEAWELYRNSYTVARQKNWFNISNAVKDGYKKQDPIHFTNKEYRLNGENLNPHKPESLVYIENSNGEKILAGFMYLTQDISSRGSQIGGPLTIWHYHPLQDKTCVREFLGKGIEFSKMECKDNKPEMKKTSEMIHVWFIKHPQGPFGSRMNVGTNLSRNVTPTMMSKIKFKNYLKNAFK